MMICDLDLLADKGQLPSVFHKLKPLLLGGWTWYMLFVTSIWLAGVPRGVPTVDEMALEDPGWWYVDRLTPPVTRNAVWYWVS